MIKQKSALNIFIVNPEKILKSISTANGAAPTGAIMSPRSHFDLAGLVDSNGNPLGVPGVVSQVPFLETSQVPIDDSHGTATDASQIIVGDFSQLMIGMRAALRIEVLQGRAGKSLVPPHGLSHRYERPLVTQSGYSPFGKNFVSLV